MVADREPEALERFDAAFPPREKLRLRVRCSESGAPGLAWGLLRDLPAAPASGRSDRAQAELR